jgi:hypothetical protein
MTTYRHTDLESLIEDLRQINQATTNSEKEQLKNELFLKISERDLENWFALCDTYMYHFERALVGDMPH